MTQITQEQIETLMRDVLGTMLEVEPFLTGERADPPPQCRTMAAAVHITGAFNGAIMLHATDDFAGRVAGTMFRIDPATATAADKQDALGELCNVVGGSLKALLDEPCRLSLPTVVQGSDYSMRIPKSDRIAQYGFNAAEEPLQLSLWQCEREAAASRAA